MSKKYKVDYHLAQGVVVSVSNVRVLNLAKLSKALSNAKKVIRVSGNGNLVQLIPVRNILCIEVKEEVV